MAQQKKPTNDSDYVYYNINDVASSNECTGLISSIPENKNQTEAYKEIYQIPKQGKNKDTTNQEH